MKKAWIILLTGMLVIGLIPGALANPKIDSNAQAQNDKQTTVTVDGANAVDAAVNQILTNNGNQDNHNAGIGGNADAISGNIATQKQKVGNDDLLGGCNSGDWSGEATSKNKAKVTDSMDTSIGQAADSNSNGDSGNGGSGCNSKPNADATLAQDSAANAVGGGGNNGDVNQANTVNQDAWAQISVDQTLTQPVDIREDQVAKAREDSSIDLNIPVSDNLDSMITVEKDNPIDENTNKNQN